MTRFNFFSYVPASVIEQIDSVVSMEVTPYIKTMGALPEKIQVAANKAAENESAGEYLSNLMSAWRAHNDLAAEIDLFLVQLYSGRRSFSEISVIQQARAFLPRVYQTEDMKRIYSVGVKIALHVNIHRATRRYSLTEKQKTLLLSCWVPDFWTYRLHAHSDYVLDKLSGRPINKKRTDLANAFHAGEPGLLDRRLSNILGKNSPTTQDVQKIITQCIHSEEIVRTFAVNGGYLCMGRSDLRSIQSLVQYDNRVEYLFSSNMFGMPDFFLRKEIAHVLVSTGVIEHRPSIVFYSQNELDNGLQQLEEKCNDSWQSIVGGTNHSTGLPANHSHNLWRGVHNDGTRSLTRNFPQ